MVIVSKNILLLPTNQKKMKKKTSETLYVYDTSTKIDFDVSLLMFRKYIFKGIFLVKI